MIRALALVFALVNVVACGHSTADEGSELAASQSRPRSPACGAHDDQAFDSMMTVSASQPAFLSDSERRGGHAIARHVGRDEQWLRERLRKEPNIPSASSYSDLPSAERFVGGRIASERERIRAWLRNGYGETRLVLDGACESSCGVGVARSGQKRVESYGTVVLEKSCVDNRPFFYVLTSYPGQASRR